jgi:uncharacterized protein YceH (UPF0502 family)
MTLDHDPHPDASPDDDDLVVLSDEEARLVGCLIEKEMTTPDQYPMSVNGVTLAANQKSNRDPVVGYSEATVERTLRDLTDRGLVRMVHRPGDRVVKYRHAVDERLGLDPQGLSLLAVLLLRGAQTPGELRQRTQRYADFPSLGDVERALDRLVDAGLVARLERRPGQKEARVVDVVAVRGRAIADGAHGDATVVMSPAVPLQPARDVDGLRAELDELRGRFEELLDRLGVDDL